MGAKRRQLTLADRRQIQGGLDAGLSVTAIARNLERSQSTVREEIMRNASSGPFEGRRIDGYRLIERRNLCAKRSGCMLDRRSIGTCPQADACRPGFCKGCRAVCCNDVCEAFEPSSCPRHSRSPFCCNGCPDLLAGRDCGHPYRLYIAELADDRARDSRSSARKGLCVDGDTLVRVTEALRYGLSRGQSIDAVYMSNEWMHGLFSASTLYRWNADQIFEGITPLDSPEIVKRRVRKRPRKGLYAHSCVSKENLEGRRYEDYEALPERDRIRAVQMDTVKGRQGVDRQCILTFQWPRFGFQLYILLPDCTSASVVSAMDMLQDAFGDDYEKFFGVVVTDQGSEFADTVGMEVNRQTGEIRGKVYYCDPFKSYQKPNCERQHEELRDVLPKRKTNFDALRPEDMALLTSNVNSYPTRKLGGLSPMDLVMPVMGGHLAKLGVEKIDPRDVNKSRWLVEHAMLPGTRPGKRPIGREAA